MINFGDVPAGSVLPVFFGSYNSSGASVALSGLAVTDIEIYKGGSITQRSSDAGYTLIDTDGIDVDGITGINGFTIDTGDNTDSGFYAVGSFYTVVVSAVTIDSQTVNFVAATFRIVADLTPSTIADAVWDEDATAHQTQGTFGQAIGDPGADTDTIFGLVNTNLNATVSSRLASASYTAPPTAAENATAVLTTAMTEAYSTDGGTVTLAQAAYELLARDQESAVSGTTMTVKKRDGSTTAYTLTLNDATNPTSVTRAS